MKLKIAILCSVAALWSVSSGVAFAAQFSTVFTAIHYTIYNDTGAVIPYFYSIDSRELTPASINTSLPVGETDFTFTVPGKVDPSFQSNIEIIASISASSTKDSVSIGSGINGDPLPSLYNVATPYGNLIVTAETTHIEGSVDHYTVHISKQ